MIRDKCLFYTEITYLVFFLSYKSTQSVQAIGSHQFKAATGTFALKDRKLSLGSVNHGALV